jgi:hypothetical protein
MTISISKTLFKTLAAFLLVCITYNANGQGCSDAGFCTVNSFKPNIFDSIAVLKNHFKIAVSYGEADHSISVLGNYIEYRRQFNQKVGAELKATSLSQSGNNITTFGLSDVFINGDYRVGKRFKLILGIKIPFTDGNKMKNNFPLPMDYQSGLGTLDLISGLGFEVKKFQFIIALQQPLTQNKNQFIAENYPSGSALRNFQSTNKFNRSGDVLLRISYPFRLSEKLKFTPGILPIFHLANDSYTNLSGIKHEISGSQGLTLNVNAFFDYEINNRNYLQLNFGGPVVKRKSRPDGLTRSFVANLEYKIKF